MLAEALRAHGFTVEVAYEAIEALEQAARKQFGVAVLDIGLPVMDGYELARRLRDYPPPHPRLFALTGYGDDLDRARSMEAGFESHFVKPVDLVSLLSAISQDPR
jgi:CheY-like chemotaxis protein